MLLWIAFILLIFFCLALDLGVFNKNPHNITAREALGWTSLWVTTALLFSIVVYFAYENNWVDNIDGLTSSGAVIKYLTGYIIEYSLSMDNIFVIAVIFAYFKIPKIYQHRVLFWGILGALFFRAIMIIAGVVLIHKFAWTTYFFGALLLYSAYKMAFADDENYDPENNPILKLMRRFFPVTTEFHGQRFFIKKNGLRIATPLFVALIIIETTDVLFAIDSIPAILAITTDPFLVFSSNMFAILGLRSLYFVLASMLDKFELLKYSLIFVLAYVGVKMILIHFVQFPEWLSISVVLVALLGGIFASIWNARRSA